MAETFPSDTTLNGLSGTADAEQAVPYIPIGLSPYHTEFYRMLYRLLDVARRAGDLRVYKDDSGALEFGVRTGKYLNGDTPVDYAGATGQNLTDNAVNTIYLTAAGALTVNTTGFPMPSVTPHIPLATIATGTQSASGVAGQYDHADITDYRGRAFLTVVAGLTDSLMAEAAAFFAATDITGAQANTLKGGPSSDADALHTHAGKLAKTLAAGKIFIGDAQNQAAAQTLSGDGSLSSGGVLTISALANKLEKALASGHLFVGNAQGTAADVAMSGDATINNAGVVTITNLARTKLAEDSLARYQIELMRMRNATGSVMSNSSEANKFYISAGGWLSGTLQLRTEAAQGNTKSDYLCFEFVLPPEYVAGQDVQLVISARYTGSGTAGTTTLYALVYELGDDGTVGGDLCTTAIQNLTSSFADYTWTITPTGLVAGDRLMIQVEGVIQETGGSTTLYGVVGNIEMQIDIKG
jgi:hypothetical protein